MNAMLAHSTIGRHHLRVDHVGSSQHGIDHHGALGAHGPVVPVGRHCAVLFHQGHGVLGGDAENERLGGEDTLLGDGGDLRLGGRGDNDEGVLVLPKGVGQSTAQHQRELEESESGFLHLGGLTCSVAVVVVGLQEC